MTHCVRTNNGLPYLTVTYQEVIYDTGLFNLMFKVIKRFVRLRTVLRINTHDPLLYNVRRIYRRFTTFKRRFLILILFSDVLRYKLTMLNQVVGW